MPRVKQFPDVHCKYGAPMGRPSRYEPIDGKVRLFRVLFYDGDYDDGGAYWGGAPAPPLYCAQDDDGKVQLFVRAPCRAVAKERLLRSHPDLRFYR
jgi:hypothetical protein